MRRFVVPALAAISLAFVVTTPATAAEIVTVKVGYADLDLNTAAGKDTLDARISAAIKTACIRPDTRNLKAVQAWEDCRDSAASSVADQLEKTVAFGSL